MTDKYAGVGGTPLVIDWKITRHFFFSWEIDTEAIEPLVPPGLEVVELRPGISLLSVGILRYQEGHFGPGSPAFSEVVSAAHVNPDLSFDMPTPRFTFASLVVTADSPEFVEQEARLIFTPTRLVPSLRLEFSPDGLGVDASDDHGPIVSLRNTHPDPVFTRAEFWGQHFTNTAGLHCGAWEWDGERFEHMRAGSAGRLYEHPHFRGLDLSRVHGCYRQMIAKPDTVSHERFYAMRRIGR